MIPALKDKSIEVLFFTFRTLKMRQIGGRYSDYGIAAIFVNIRVQKSKIRYKLACKRICDFGTLMLNKICESVAPRTIRPGHDVKVMSGIFYSQIYSPTNKNFISGGEHYEKNA